MTAFNTSILVTADTAQAVPALKGVEGSLRALGPAADVGANKASAALRSMGGASRAVTSNLVAQFNDVGVMLASGQSPLLLAAQQGSQISQALGPLGAGGAVRALGAAFLGMLNPLNFAIFAGVAALGLLANAFRSIGGETKDLGDAIGDLSKATKAWREAAGRDLADLKREFGTITPEIVEMQRQLTELALVDQLIAASGAARALSDDLDGLFQSRRGAIANLFDLGNFDEVTLTRGAAPQANAINSLLDDLPSADGAAAQLDIVRQIKAEILNAAGGVERMTEGQREFFRGVVQVERGLTAVKLAQDGIGSAQARAVQTGEKLLADLRAEADLKLLIRTFGEDSVEVARARVSAEQAAFAAMLDTAGITGDLRTELETAWRAARGLGTTDIGRGVAEAAAAAEKLAKELNISLRSASAILALGKKAPVVLDPRDPRFDPDAARRVRLQDTAAQLRTGAGTVSPFDPARQDRPAATGRTGAGRASRSGDDAARAALAAGRAELAILREADPLRREELRLRERMTEASDELIGQLARENLLLSNQRATVDNLRGTWRDFSRTAAGALDGLIVQGNSLRSVLSDLLRSLASTVLQGALLGGGLGGSTGGLFGAIGRGLGIPGLAGGGLVAGPGGPRDDRILARLSAGEFVVNAAATTRNRGLLEAINAAPRFASGGIVGGSRQTGGTATALGGPLTIDLRLSDDLDARVAAAAEGVAVRVSRDSIGAYDKLALPGRVAQISRDPRRRG